MMEKKKKRSALFYALFLLVYILIVLGVIAFFLTKVWGFAEEYEAARPVHTMDAYVENQGNKNREKRSKLWCRLTCTPYSLHSYRFML